MNIDALIINAIREDLPDTQAIRLQILNGGSKKQTRMPKTAACACAAVILAAVSTGIYLLHGSNTPPSATDNNSMSNMSETTDSSRSSALQNDISDNRPKKILYGNEVTDYYHADIFPSYMPENMSRRYEDEVQLTLTLDDNGKIIADTFWTSYEEKVYEKGIHKIFDMFVSRVSSNTAEDVLYSPIEENIRTVKMINGIEVTFYRAESETAEHGAFFCLNGSSFALRGWALTDEEFGRITESIIDRNS